MRVLITGAGGFVGNHLIHHLRHTTPDAELHGTVLHASQMNTTPDVALHIVDLRDEAAVHLLIESIKPEQIYHLAGQSFVPRSFEAPWETLEINIRAQLNLFLSAIALKINPRILITASAEIYGAAAKMPITEDTPLQPSSPYSVSKVAQDLLGLQYHLSHGLPILRARAFNHIGPGQDERFVAPAFAMQIARIEAGLQPPLMLVGDLSAQRDFTDVRDIANAYRLLIERGESGAAYNVASGSVHSAQEMLDILFSFTSIKIDVQIDEARMRPTRIPILQGDATRLRDKTGWQPKVSLEQTLRDVLEDCRQRLTTH